jgi:predicted outer membrane repeat protein
VYFCVEIFLVLISLRVYKIPILCVVNAQASGPGTGMGGGIRIRSGSTLILRGRATVADNVAEEKGGGIAAGASTVHLEDKATVRGNVAKSGGGIFVESPTGKLTVARTAQARIVENSATKRGGGIYAEGKSSLALSFGSVVLRANRAQFDGGGVALDTGSSLSADNCTLVVISNVAVAGDGGGLALFGEASLNITGSTPAVVRNNTAGGRGGGMAFMSLPVSASSQDTVHWHRLELAANTAASGDGGGFFASRKVRLLPSSGVTVLYGNTAPTGRGGGVAVSSAMVKIGHDHALQVVQNSAHHGGGVAILDGGSILIGSLMCPVDCKPEARGDGVCDQECLSPACNWDNGDCNRLLSEAGADARQPCDRNTCTQWWQTASTCVDGCFTASCDWSRNMCVDSKQNISTCPLQDAVAYQSIRSEQQRSSGPTFLNSGNSGGWGRCNSSCTAPTLPPAASVMQCIGRVNGGSSLHMDGHGHWIHADLLQASIQDSFTVEAWFRPSEEASFNHTVGFLVAGHNFALGLHASKEANAIWPLMFVNKPPKAACSAGPVIVTAASGVLSDGPDYSARDRVDGAPPCEWIVRPAGAERISFVFTELDMIKEEDAVSIFECYDVSCNATSAATVFTGLRIPPPFTSNSSVVLVRLEGYMGYDTRGRGFTALYAASLANTRIGTSNWQHIAVSVGSSGLTSLYVNGNLAWAGAVDYHPEQEPPFSGEWGTAIGRGAPSWQDGGDMGYFKGSIDLVRVWRSVQTAPEVVSNMQQPCSDAPFVAVCFDFDDGIEGQNPHFADASGSGISAFTAAGGSPHLPWCANVDDDGLAYHFITESMVPMWGFCAPDDKPRLPGSGSGYNITEMEAAVMQLSSASVAVLTEYPGCGTVPLNVTANTAHGHGGGVYYSSCARLDQACFLGGLDATAGSSAAIFASNRAQSGGAIFVKCPALKQCAETFSRNNTIGALPSLPKAEFHLNNVSAYGKSIATMATLIAWHGTLASIITLVPGQQTLSFAVESYDSLGQLVVGSEDIIEVLICREEPGPCTAQSAILTPQYVGFDAATGRSAVDMAVECPLGKTVSLIAMNTSMLFQVRVVGSTDVPHLVGRIRCSMCQKGQRLVTHDSRGTWSCERCSQGTYNINPLTGICLVCPSTATCVNGVPIFGASAARGAIEMELADDSSGDTIRDTLAATIGVEVWQISEILAMGLEQRRAQQRIEFTLVADAAQMAGLAARLTSIGVELGDPERLGAETAAEGVWEEVEGQYILRRCPPGNLLVNTSTDGNFDVNVQRCLPCGPNRYLVEGSNACVKCPDGIFLDFPCQSVTRLTVFN